MTKDLRSRIAIIGAGAAGLTAAETLKRKGYTNITLLERSNRAGGKCYSVEYKDQAYELGAGIIAINNTTVLNLAKQFNVPFEPVEYGKSVLWDTETSQPVPKTTVGKKLALIWQLFVRYRKLAHRYARVTQPGLANIDPTLYQPFAQWAKQHNVGLVARELESFFTGFGYGYYDEIPATYVLKYYSWETVKAFLHHQIFKFPNGIQTLWTTVAKANNVLYNTHIKKIQRGKKITITTEKQELEFDQLIITSPLDETVDFLDASTEEKNLFSKIIYCDYRTYACFLKNFPNQSGYIPGNYHASRMGHPVFWYQRFTNSNLYTFYVLGDWNIKNEDVLSNIESVVKQFGGTIERLHITAHWKYFPHVSPEDMQAGFYEQLESLQGQKHTYYAGEIMNFSTVGLTSAYAEKLVEENFSLALQQIQNFI